MQVDVSQTFDSQLKNSKIYHIHICLFLPTTQKLIYRGCVFYWTPPRTLTNETWRGILRKSFYRLQLGVIFLAASKYERRSTKVHKHGKMKMKLSLHRNHGNLPWLFNYFTRPPQSEITLLDMCPGVGKFIYKKFCWTCGTAGGRVR